MSGVYGWNIGVDESGESEYESQKMPMPYDEDNTSDVETPFSLPQIKGCCFFCCSGDEDDVPQQPGGGARVEMDEKGFYWCEYNGSVPDTAVKAGIDKDGGTIYVGRAIHEGEMLPAKVIPNHGCAYISYAGEEESKAEFEVLCRGTCSVIWQESSDGAVPPEAVPAGRTSDDEKLYVGRVFHDGTHTPGKVHPSHGCCYIGYEGEEHSFTSYEVLILK